MKINPLISQSENMYALITAANPEVVNNYLNLTLGEPVAVTDVVGYNTAIVLTGIPGQGFKGTRTFYYNRLAFSAGQGLDASKLGPITIDPEGGEYGAFLKVLESVGIPSGDGILGSSMTMPIDVDTPGSITLNAASDSFLYLQAEPVTIVLQFPAA